MGERKKETKERMAKAKKMWRGEGIFKRRGRRKWNLKCLEKRRKERKERNKGTGKSLGINVRARNVVGLQRLRLKLFRSFARLILRRINMQTCLLN